jgi:uncharacterized SAM-binding protein YcdF (DUF218 family)
MLDVIAPRRISLAECAFLTIFQNAFFHAAVVRQAYLIRSYFVTDKIFSRNDKKCE